MCVYLFIQSLRVWHLSLPPGMPWGPSAVCCLQPVATHKTRGSNHETRLGDWRLLTQHHIVHRKCKSVGPNGKFSLYICIYVLNTDSRHHQMLRRAIFHCFFVVPAVLLIWLVSGIIDNGTMWTSPHSSGLHSHIVCWSWSLPPQRQHLWSHRLCPASEEPVSHKHGHL